MSPIKFSDTTPQAHIYFFAETAYLTYLCGKQQSMKRIRLTKDEKHVLLHVRDHGEEQPPTISPAVFRFCLSTLQEKGLLFFRNNYNEVIIAKLTIKGEAYLEQNPKLRNPVDWLEIIKLVFLGLTAVASIVALFVACRSLIQ